MVGKQASNLDLVNGKLGDQLSKLKKIKANELKKNVEDAEDSYNKSKISEKHSKGNADKKGNDVSVKLNNKMLSIEEKILDADISGLAISTGIFSNIATGGTLSIRVTDSIESIEEKIKILKELKDYIGNNGLKDTYGWDEIYTQLISAIENYKNYEDSTSKSITSLIDSIIAQETNNMPTVDSPESYENTRQKILSLILSNNTIKEAIDNKDITEDELKSTVNSAISTLDGFGTYYDEWAKKYLGKSGNTIEDETLTTQEKVLSSIVPNSLWLEKSNKSDGRHSSGRKSEQFNYNNREKYYKELKSIIANIDDFDTLDVMEDFTDSDWNNIVDRAIMYDNRSYSREDQLIEVIGDYVYSKIKQNLSTDASSNSFVPTFSDIFVQADESDATKTELSDKYQALFTNLEKVKTAFQTLKSAQEEYNNYGVLSIDTIKSLMETGDDWLNYLTIEDGQLKINEQGYVDLARAKLNALKTEMYNGVKSQIESLQNASDAAAWSTEQNGELANSYDNLTSSIKASTLAILENKLVTSNDDSEKQKWQSAIESTKNAFDKIDQLISEQNPIETGITVSCLV